MESFQDRINQLINDMIKSGIPPEKIMWILSSTGIKKCDIYYRIDHELPTSRDAEPVDGPDGDSIHVPSTTLEDMNREIVKYKSHDTDCNCYLATNDCPICQEGIVKTKLGCCNNWYHQECLIKWYYENNKCPTCRHIMIMEDGIIVPRPKSLEKVLFIDKPYPVREGGASPEVVRGGFSGCCYACGVQGHMAFNCPTCCYACGVQGHMAFNCPTEGIATLQGTERVPTTRLNERDTYGQEDLASELDDNPENHTVWGRDDDDIPIVSLEDPLEEDIPSSEGSTINVRPMAGHPGTFIDINHGFVLHQHDDGSIVVSHVSNGPGIYDLRSLTDDEVRTAQILGLAVDRSAPVIPPSNNNANNSPRVIEPENNIPRIQRCIYTFSRGVK